MKYLILIDKKFPYKSGEPFLENEINEIPSEFEQVIIFPIDIAKNEQQTRKINRKKVKTIPVNLLKYKVRKIRYGMVSIIKALFRNQSKLSFAQNFEQKVDEVMSKEIGNKIIRKLQDYHFSNEDEVVIYSYWLHTTASIAIRVKKYLNSIGCKTIAVSRAHRFDIYEEERKNSFLPSRFSIFSGLDSVYSISEDGKNYLQTHYPNFAEKFNVSKLGTYDHGTNQFTKEKFHILSVSRLTPVKRVNLIIEALSFWDNKNVVWTHIGDGPEEVRLKKLAEKKLTNVDVRFLGYRTNKEVYSYYKTNPVDLFVNVSASEGIPVSIMEAISFGVPVCATNVGGNSEIAISGQTGYLLPYDFEVKGFVNILIGMYNQEHNSKNYLRETARSFWQNNYFAKKNYPEFYRCILKELENGKA